MDLTTIIVIVLSLVLVYFLGSTLVSLILELWSSMRNNREKFLKKQLNERLGTDAAQNILEHPMVSGASKNSTRKIPAKVFGYVANQHLDKDSNQVLHSAIGAYGTAGTTKSVPADETTSPPTTVESKDSTTTETEKSTSADATSADSQTATSTDNDSTADNQNALSSWYNDFSKDMSSQYRKSMRIPSLVVSAIVVIVLNLDTLRIIKTIWENPEDNTEILSTLSQIDWVSLATEEPNPADSESTSEQIQEILLILSKLDSLESAGIPIGWQTGEDLGLVIPASDTFALIEFTEVMQVDTGSGRADTSYSFSYRPPTGADSYQSEAKIADNDENLLAVFPSAIPKPNPQLVSADGALKLDFSHVFGNRKLDSLKAEFQGITGEVYSFKASAHQETIRPSIFEVFIANLKAIEVLTLLGWLISIIALSMGAPFWYDILKRLTEYLTGAEK